MNKLKEIFNISRTQRIGIAVIIVVMAGIIGINALYSSPQVDVKENARLYSEFKQSTEAAQTDTIKAIRHKKAKRPSESSRTIQEVPAIDE